MRTGLNQRNTKQRRVILEELRALKSHPTAADLYDVVRKRLPRISLGTIYRNLELLVDSRIIRKVEIGGKEARFDAIPTDHHHIYCIHCNRIDDIPNSSEARADITEADPSGWQIRERRIELFGVCPDCNTLGGSRNQ